MSNKTSDDDQVQRSDLRSFGRRRGRRLSPRQEALMEDLLPRVAVDPARPLAVSGWGPAPATEGVTAGVWLEIGFGGAEHLIWQAEHHPQVRIIGCEPFEEGVVKALSAISVRDLANVRLHPDDARPLIRCLPDSSLDRVFILFPDPWPKKRHAKRRLVTSATLADLVRVMRPGAELRIGTDIGAYARTVLLAVAATPGLAWTASCAAHWRVRPDDWPQTRYEAKAAREGRRCYYLRFERSH